MERPTRIKGKYPSILYSNDVINRIWHNRYEYKTYSSRSAAYDAIPEIIKYIIKEYNNICCGPMKEPIEKLVTRDLFSLHDAERWFQNGYETEDDYLDHIAYTG